MEIDDNRYYKPEKGKKNWFNKNSNIALLFFLFGIGYFLVTEHWAHIVPFLPWLIILLCPLIHIFHHRGHGAHGIHDKEKK